MALEHYEKWVISDEGATYPYQHDHPDEELMYLGLAIAGEAGETANEVKKYVRGSKDWSKARREIAYEMGDVLWYMVRLANSLGLDLYTIAAMNKDKLLRRRARD